MAVTTVRPLTCLQYNLAAVLFVCILQTSNSQAEIERVSNNKEATPRIALTPASYQHLMRENEGSVMQRLQAHIDALHWHLNVNQLDQYTAFTTAIDQSANRARARRLQRGISRMLDTIKQQIVQYEVACNPEIKHKRYGWANYPYLHHCNGFEDNIRGQMGWHFHEVSHFPPPHGMGTRDETYSRVQCLEWAETAPAKTLATAHCVSTFLLMPAGEITQ